MEKEEQKKKFLEWIAKNYNRQKKKLIAYTKNKQLEFDEDIFQDCILKIVDKIEKNGILDDSDTGFDNYFFITFKTNLAREKQYARNKKKNENANLDIAHEEFLNGELTEREKLKQDLFRDYSMIYLLKKIEEEFPPSDCRLFRLKLFNQLTYKELSDLTNEKNIRQRVVAIKKYLYTIKKEEILTAFNLEYGNL